MSPAARTDRIPFIAPPDNSRLCFAPPPSASKILARDLREGQEIIGAMDRDTLTYWGDTYAANWCPRPLVQPAAEDITFFENCARDVGAPGGLRALMLGVTRPIAAMSWPKDTRLVALDWSEPVIRRLWRAEGTPLGSSPVRGDWREIPFAGASRDIALSDGCFHCLASHEDGALVLAEVRRVLAEGGLFCTRSFLAADPPERVDDLFDELQAGRTENLHVFRWRLAAALQGRSRVGAARRDIWEAWRRHGGFESRVRAMYDGADGGFSIVEKYRDLGGCLYFFTLANLQELAAGLELLRQEVPDYPGGHRFPRLVMRARSSAQETRKAAR